MHAKFSNHITCRIDKKDFPSISRFIGKLLGECTLLFKTSKGYLKYMLFQIDI